MDRNKVEEYYWAEVKCLTLCLLFCNLAGNTTVVGHLYANHCSSRNQLAKVTVFGTQIGADIMYISCIVQK